MGGGLGMHPACHHTQKKISGEPTGQDFPPPSLPPLSPTPDPEAGKAAGSPLPPRGLGAQLLICVPEDKKCLEVLLQDGSLAGEGAVLLQSPTATQKPLISLHFLGSKSKSALRSRPSRTEDRPVGEQREKKHTKMFAITPRDFQFARELQVLSVAPPSSVWFLNVCFPVTMDGVWVWGVASLKSGAVSSDSLLWEKGLN